MKLTRSKTIFFVLCLVLLGVGITYQNCGQLKQESNSNPASSNLNLNSPQIQRALQAAQATSSAKSSDELGFAEMIDRAGMVVEAEVVSITYATSPERQTFTFATFNTKDTFKGTMPKTFELRFLGGHVGNETIKVSGMPEFKKGEYVVLFLKSEMDPVKMFSPLMGFNQGVFKIKKDRSGVQNVFNNNGSKVLAHDEASDRLVTYSEYKPRKNIPVSQDPKKKDKLVEYVPTEREKTALSKDQFTQIIASVIKEGGLQGTEFKPMSDTDKLKSLRLAYVPAPEVKERGAK